MEGEGVLVDLDITSLRVRYQHTCGTPVDHTWVSIVLEDPGMEERRGRVRVQRVTDACPSPVRDEDTARPRVAARQGECSTQPARAYPGEASDWRSETSQTLHENMSGRFWGSGEAKVLQACLTPYRARSHRGSAQHSVRKDNGSRGQCRVTGDESECWVASVARRHRAYTESELYRCARPSIPNQVMRTTHDARTRPQH